MTKLFLTLAFFISVFTLPGWASALLAVVLLSEGGSVTLVIIGGLCIDIFFGAPIALLHGFAYLYTALFALLAVCALYLRTQLLE